MFRSWKTWIGNVEMAGEIYTRAVLSFTRRSDLETRFEDEGREGEGSQGRGLSHTKIQFYKNIELVMRNSRWVTLVADKNSKKPARSWLVHATAPSHAPGQWEKSTPLCALSPSSPPPPPPALLSRSLVACAFDPPLRARGETRRRFLPIRATNEESNQFLSTVSNTRHFSFPSNLFANDSRASRTLYFR